MQKVAWTKTRLSGMTCATVAISVTHASSAIVATATFVINAHWCEAPGVLPVRSVAIGDVVQGAGERPMQV